MRRFILPSLIFLAAIPSIARPDEPAALHGEMEFLGQTIRPGEHVEIGLVTGESFAGDPVAIPVFVQRGMSPGPTLCLTGGIHGDEVNGVEIVRRVLRRSDTRTLSGTLVGVPIVNLQGFRRRSRYLPDRRDLNRHFPGRPDGSAASRIARRLFDTVVRRCDYLVDFHAGSFHRRNLPQVRADLSREAVHALALGSGPEVVVHTMGTRGTLRRAATEAGIPAITYEAGEPTEFRETEVARGVEGMMRLLAHLKMSGQGTSARSAPQIFYRSRWVRANEGGIFLSVVPLGARVKRGMILGHITDPISNERTDLVANHSGRVIGMAVNQVVIPGFATFHVGIEDGKPKKFDTTEDEPMSALDETVELDERPE